jgi:phytoene dehydrogenase-like protein
MREFNCSFLRICQGVIGTAASPFDKGTASVFFFHASGRMNGIPGGTFLSSLSSTSSFSFSLFLSSTLLYFLGWGYIEKGMGHISNLIADACREYGVTILTNTEIKEIIPGTGVCFFLCALNSSRFNKIIQTFGQNILNFNNIDSVLGD